MEKKFITEYLLEIQKIANTLDQEKILRIIKHLADLRRNKGRLFILGVGGSAGNASHAVNDFRKLANLDAYSPTDNVSEITARTNDEGWETVFMEYLKVSNFTESDAILILSVGGGDLEKKISVNLCNAIDYSLEKKGKVLAIVGRESGHAAKYSTECLVIPIVNNDRITPHSEAFQSIIWHLFVSHPILKVQKTKW